MSALFHSVKFKIRAAFGACILLMLIIGGSAAIGINTLNNSATEMFNENLIPILRIATIRGSVVDIRLQFRRAQLFHNLKETQESLRRIAHIQGDLKKNWSGYYPRGVSSPEEKILADSINANLQKFDTVVADIGAMLTAEKYPEAINAMEQVMTPLANDIKRDVIRNLDNNVEQSRQALDDNSHAGNQVLWTVIVCIAAGMVFGLLASIFILRTIAQPLQQSIDIANQIADGKLDNAIRSDSKGEFRHLLAALSRMDVQLGDIVRGIKTSSNTIATASSEIATGNLDLSSRTEQQASSLEETASAMEELTSTVKQNSDNARSASQLAVSASEVAIKGGTAVEDVVTTMSSIHESSTKIVDIIGVIDGIAFQTNILALNAAVEAARAGEQGRGFAVVASEVRSLAQRSAAAAKEIKTLIDDSVEKVDIGTRQVADAGATMKQVVSSVQRVTHIVGEISAASQEQATGIEEVNRAIAQMDEVTQQNAALVEQAAAAAQSLNEQASNLAESVKVFVLKE